MIHVFFSDGREPEHIEDAVRAELEAPFAVEPGSYAGPTVCRCYDAENQPVAQFDLDLVAGYQVDNEPVVTLLPAGSVKKL